MNRGIGIGRWKRPSLTERIEAMSMPLPWSGCTVWLGATSNGYGITSIDGANRLAHRVSYELAKGPIPAGLEIDHKCKVRCCINPDHLEPVTGWENNRRSGSPSAKNLVKTHCDHGHEFSTENTRLYQGKRLCRACDREKVRRYRAKKIKVEQIEEPAREASGAWAA
jgi:hypothetical protein